MKKLLVVLLSAAMVLSLAAVSMAAITLSGDVSSKYDFHGGADSYEAKLTAESKVNDQLSAKLVFKGASGKDVVTDEWSFTYKPGFADIQVGYYEYKIKGLVDVLSWDGFKSYAGITVSKALDNGFNLGLFYTPDATSDKTLMEDNGYALNIGYSNDAFDVDAYIYDKQFDASDISYSVTGALTIWDNFTPYLSYLADNTEVLDTNKCIIGGKFVADALEVRAEYDLESDNDDYYGIKIKYAFKSGIYTEYVYTNQDGDTLKDEIKFGVKFK